MVKIASIGSRRHNKTGSKIDICSKKIRRKGENVGYQHFLLFPRCFEKLSFSGKKTLWEKEKMLVTNIFFFSRVVLKNFFSQGI